MKRNILCLVFLLYFLLRPLVCMQRKTSNNTEYTAIPSPQLLAEKYVRNLRELKERTQGYVDSQAFQVFNPPQLDAMSMMLKNMITTLALFPRNEEIVLHKHGIYADTATLLEIAKIEEIELRHERRKEQKVADELEKKRYELELELARKKKDEEEEKIKRLEKKLKRSSSGKKSHSHHKE